MPIPFLSSISLNKNEVQDFKVFNLGSDPTLTSGGDFGYLWLNTSGTKTLKFWDGTNIRSLIDSTTISSSTAGLATDLAGGGAGQIVYQNAANDTMFLSAGTSGQVLSSNGASAPSWLNQSSLSVGSATTATTATTATNVAGGSNGSILVQSGVGTTGQLAIGASGYILTSNGTTPGWSATIPSSAVSGLAASATTDTTNASNISSGTLGLARLTLASGQFYVGDGSNNPAATAKSSIRLSGFGTPNADVAMGGYKLTGLGAPTASTDAATMGYVDSVAQGLDVKASCKAATVSNINLASPGATIDTVSLSVDNRVLVKDQSLPAENGIYLWKGAAVAMVRSPDADTWDELVGAFTFVEEGTTANADSGWVCTVNAGGTLGTTAVTWTKFSQAGSYTAGNGMVLSGGVFHFAQSSAYTAGQIPFASSTSAIGFSSNLFWDNSNSRLGIGTASPGTKVDIIGGAIRINNSSLGSAANDGILLDNYAAASPNNYLPAINWNTGTLTWATIDGLRAGGGGYGGTIRVNTMDSSGVNTERLRIASDGVCTWSNVGGVAGTAMTLNANGLGIGGGPVAPDGASRTFQIGSSTVIQTPVGEQTSFSNNTYYDGTSWKRIVANRFCNSIRFNGLGNTGDITFSCAGTGAANSVLTNWDTSDVKMVLNYLGNLGINATTPAYKLHVNAANPGNGVIAQFYNNATSSLNGASIILTQYGIADWYVGQPAGVSALEFGRDKTSSAAGTPLMRLDSSGNLGLGATPSAWSGGRAIDVGTSGAFYGDGLTYDWRVGATMNAYRKVAFNNWYYKATGQPAGRYDVASGGSTGVVHTWQTAASGTADALISWTTAMTLDASGNLRVGAAAAAGVLTVTNSTTNTSIGLINLSGFANTNTNSIDFYLDNSNSGVVTHGVIGCINTAATANRYGELFFKTANAAAPVTRIRIKAQGQLNLVPISADPAGPEAGDVYYNSTSNTLKWYGTAWNTLPRKYVVQLSDGSVTVLGNAYTITHNLGSQDVTVSIRRTTDNAVVQADVVMPAGGNTVTVTFAAAITAAQFYVTVIG